MWTEGSVAVPLFHKDSKFSTAGADFITGLHQSGVNGYNNLSRPLSHCSRTMLLEVRRKSVCGRCGDDFGLNMVEVVDALYIKIDMADTSVASSFNPTIQEPTWNDKRIKLSGKTKVETNSCPVKHNLNRHNFNYVYNYLMYINPSFIDSFEDPGPHGRDRCLDHMFT
ncbi:hypothetical protein M8C21_005252 [Ambrosia artemisiifolia]|uniref:Uncharacterized protein n=1 Tax=Ambrosia artemisiifolia TaxID=4212 RepID=A0AAD5CNP2_AMBAR|nr:hypothetical protein M8C21_005252 [Ambrosia artemisiifolia]